MVNPPAAITALPIRLLPVEAHSAITHEKVIASQKPLNKDHSGDIQMNFTLII